MKKSSTFIHLIILFCFVFKIYVFHFEKITKDISDGGIVAVGKVVVAVVDKMIVVGKEVVVGEDKRRTIVVVGKVAVVVDNFVVVEDKLVVVEDKVAAVVVVEKAAAKDTLAAAENHTPPSPPLHYLV